MRYKPINLNLFTISFPVTAIASILHRISGVVLFLMIPFLLWVLQLSTASQQEFMQLVQLFEPKWVRVIIWVGLSALLYHLFAGTRHLIMDFGIGESYLIGRITAYIVVSISIFSSLLSGYYLLW